MKGYQVLGRLSPPAPAAVNAKLSPPLSFDHGNAHLSLAPNKVEKQKHSGLDLLNLQQTLTCSELPFIFRTEGRFGHLLPCPGSASSMR